MRTADKIGKVIVLMGTDHHLVGTLEYSYVDELGVTWAGMGPDTDQWGDDTADGPRDGVYRVGRQEIPQTHVKSIALAVDRWPGYRHGE